MKTIIEINTKHDEAIKTIANYFKLHGWNKAKLYNAIYCQLLIGKGGHHIWYKDSNDIHTRLAITYLD